MHSKESLSELELDVVNSNFSKDSLLSLQLAYRQSNELFQNLQPIHIAIPIADRSKSLDNLLTSIKDELSLYGFPSSLMSVHIFNDSHNDLDKTDLGELNFGINVWNIFDQVNFIIKEYNMDLIKQIEGKFIKKLPLNNETWEKKGSGTTMNIARLIMNRTIDPNNSIIWFIDSDEEFSILTKNKNSFVVVPHAFSAFHSIEEVFHQFNADIVTGKITGDPAFSAPQMIRTQLIDILNNTQVDLPIHSYYHQNRAYNDLALFSQSQLDKNYTTGYPLLPFNDRGDSKLHPFHSILFGHHISRPICYSNPEKVLKNGILDRHTSLGDIIWPGNVAGNRKVLEYPTPFVEAKIRLHGPILGRLMKKMGEKIYTSNIPLYHRRIADINDITDGFRGGTENYQDLTDISTLRSKQIEGDIVAKYIERCNDQYDIIDHSLLEQVQDEIISLYQQQITDINILLQELNEGINNDLTYLKKSLLYSINKIKIGLSGDIHLHLGEVLNHLSNYKKDLDIWRNLLNS